MELSTHLSANDRRRWAKLVEWVKYSEQVTNVQLGHLLGCANSTISDWINQKRSELHDDKLESMAELLNLTKSSLLKLIQEDSDLPFAQRIELMRASSRGRRSRQRSSANIEDVLNKLYLLPPSDLPRVIEVAVSRLNNLSNARVPSMSHMLCQEQRIKISRLVWVSAEYRERKGGFYEKAMNDILKTTPFLREILSAKGKDFLLSVPDILCSLEEPVKQAIVAFCYVVTWEHGKPAVNEPASLYADFDQIIKSLSEECSTQDFCQLRS